MLEIHEERTRLIYEYGNNLVKEDLFGGKYNRVEYNYYNQHRDEVRFLSAFSRCITLMRDGEILYMENLMPVYDLLSRIDKAEMIYEHIEDIAKELNCDVDWEYIYHLCQTEGLDIEQVSNGINYGIRGDRLVLMNYTEFR